MPLQNRVSPDMQIVVENWRGNFMGNRGGRIHDPETKTLLKRKWASKRWIICVTQFKQRQREVMGQGYTELFFLDEVSALAAGHRPCFECRRRDADMFAKAWKAVHGRPEGSFADGMDKQLHEERTNGFTPLSKAQIDNLPDGAMIKVGDNCFAKKEDRFLMWTGFGYEQAKLPDDEMILLTPPSILETLKKGYIPHWHGSAS